MILEISNNHEWGVLACSLGFNVHTTQEVQVDKRNLNNIIGMRRLNNFKGIVSKRIFDKLDKGEIDNITLRYKECI